MSCPGNTVADYVHGFLEGEAAAEVREHVSSCSSCRTDLERLETERDLIARAALDFSREAKSADPITTVDTQAVKPRARLRERLVIAASLLLCATLIWGIISYPGSDKQQPPPKEESAEAKIESLIVKLGSKDRLASDSAAAKLLQFGETARPALEKASRGSQESLRARASEIIEILDRKVIQGSIAANSGRVGNTGIFWIVRDAFPLLEKKENIPAWMKPALIHASQVTVLIADLGPTGVRASSIHVFKRHGDDRKKTVLMALQYRVPHSAKRKLTLWMTGLYPRWFSQLEEEQAFEFFRVWPRFRRASIVLISTHSSKQIREEYYGKLRKMVSSPQPEIRAVAVHSLRWYFMEESVSTAFAATRDVDPVVQNSARSALDVLLQRPKVPLPQLEQWWSGLPEKKRKDILVSSMASVPADQYPWFEDQ